MKSSGMTSLSPALQAIIDNACREHNRQAAAMQEAAKVINEQLKKLVRGPEKVDAADFGITADVLEQLVENARAVKYLREDFPGAKLAVTFESSITMNGAPPAG